MGARDAGIALLLTLMLPPAAGAAQTFATPGDTVFLLPGVEVVRERAVDAARRMPTAFVSEFRLGTSGRALETLSEVLAQAAGVHVQQYGGLGSFSVMSLRGSPAGQVAIFLDGTPLSSAAHGVVNLADLPATAIERVEVYRGVSPLSLGLPGAAGAVNLVTLSRAVTRELHVTRGSFATWEARASGSGARGPWNGLLHAGYQGSAGDFRYPDDNGTPFNPADDARSRRLDNRFDAATGLASLGFRPCPGVRVTARADVFGKRQGVPGLGSIPVTGPRLSFERGLGQIEARFDGRGARPDLTVRAGLDRERTRFEDRTAALGLGRHQTDDRVRSQHTGLELEWANLVPGVGIETGGTLGREQAGLHDALSAYADPAPSRRDSRGAALGLQLRPGERLLLRAARRWDVLEDRLRARAGGGAEIRSDVRHLLDTPQLGARLAAGAGMEIKGNWSKAARAPDFLELFGNQGSVIGNPLLRPERVESWDAGLSWTAPARAVVRAGATWTHYESRARDLILYGRNSQSSVRAENASRTRVRGEELSARLARGDLALTASLTLQSAIDRGDAPAYAGKHLPQRPAREGYARADWTRPRLRLGADLQVLSDNFLDRYNQYRVRSRTLLGASLAFTPFDRPLRVAIEGKNLLDRQIEDVVGFPLPGRAVFVSLQARLGAGRQP